MKNNFYKLLMVLVVSVLLLSGCNSARYTEGGAHHHGVNNRSYRGY
jgi:uncharacterized protein YceK